MSRRSDEAPIRARVPKDIERPDRIAFGMSGRQLAILAVTGLLSYAAWTAVARLVHPLVFLAGAMPPTAGAFLVAVGRRDGISLDAWVLAALRHRRSPRRLVPADKPVIPAPARVAIPMSGGTTSIQAVTRTRVLISTLWSIVTGVNPVPRPQVAVKAACAELFRTARTLFRLTSRRSGLPPGRCSHTGRNLRPAASAREECHEHS